MNEHITNDIGRVIPLHRGDYSATIEYELNDIVSYNGSTYWHFTHEKTTGILPIDTSVWKLVIDMADAEQYIARAETAALQAEGYADDAEEAAEHYPYIDTTTKHWFVWDLSTGEYTDTGIVAEGEKGDNGNGIASIAKTGTEGNVDTYTITYTDGNTTTFEVTNGSVTSVNGRTGAVTGLAEQEDVDELNNDLNDIRFDKYAPIFSKDITFTSEYQGHYINLNTVTEPGFSLICLSNHTKLTSIGVIRNGTWYKNTTEYYKGTTIAYIQFECQTDDILALIPSTGYTINLYARVYKKTTAFTDEEIKALSFDFYSFLELIEIENTELKSLNANSVPRFVNKLENVEQVSIDYTPQVTGEHRVILENVESGFYLISLSNSTNVYRVGVIRDGTWHKLEPPITFGDNTYIQFECQAGDIISVAGYETRRISLTAFVYRKDNAFTEQETINYVYSLKSILTMLENREFEFNKWDGKNALVIGDSLTAAGRWQQQLHNILGMNVTTHALGGIGMTTCVDGNGTDFPALSVADVTGKDLIVFYAGYNDRGVTDGTVGDVYPTNPTIAGRLQYVINRIFELLTQASNLKCKVIIMTPHCGGKYSWINADGYDHYPKNSNQTLGTLAQIEEDVAHHNSLPCLNLYKLSGVNKFTWNIYQASSTPKNNDYVEYEIDSEGHVIGTEPLRYVTGQSYYQFRSGNVVLEEYTGTAPYPFNNDQLHMNNDGYDHIGEYIARWILIN